jgi:hypothetical protein
LFGMTEDLVALKDDMTAFIAGTGLKRFQGYVSDDVQSVMWDAEGNPDSWKSFVELAVSAGAPFITMNESILSRQDVDYLVERLQRSNYASDEEMEDARWLRTYIGKSGFVQLGWPFQGIMFLFEASTEWYDRYQRLLDMADDLGNITIDEPGQDDER